MTDRESVFEFSPEERGFEPVEDDDSDALYRTEQTRDATGKVDRVEFAARGTERTGFYAQRVKRNADGQIVGKDTFGTKKNDREEAAEAIESRVRKRTAAGFGGFSIGEFNVGDDQDIGLARRAHLTRSEQARSADRGKRARVTTDASRYAKQPGELDYPGVDTPSAEPQVLPKDLRQEQRPNTTDPERDRQAVERAEETVAETDTGLLLESEAEASATDSDVIGAFVSGRAESRDVSVSRGEAVRGERTDSIVSFAGPQFDANRERPRETDRREREEEMGIVPEQAFMQSGDTGGGMGVSLTSEDRSVLETLARSNMASGDRPEKIEEARLSEDPSPEAREAVVETGESILNFRDEIEDPSRTDTEFFTGDDLDRVGSVVSKFRGDR